ncbi:MAG: response regulator, partial [Planctomycetaceae bacterium]|nr:response regulator [Planctomycetaceae bacterium]
VDADEAEVEQAVINLVINSRDAMPSKGTITIQTCLVTLSKNELPQHCNPGQFVQLSVTDNGSGMIPEVMERVFEPFFTTKPVGEGTGLGLSTVYSDMRKNYGFASVKSSETTGTIVTLNFPQSQSLKAEKTASKSQSSNDFPGGSETILVCDDEEIVLESMIHLLQCVGYTVIAANSPGKALEAAAASTNVISLLLTDITMPQMSGFELGKEFKRLHPKMKIIYSSGYTEDRLSGDTQSDDILFFDKGESSAKLLQQIRILLD